MFLILQEDRFKHLNLSTIQILKNEIENLRD